MKYYRIFNIMLCFVIVFVSIPFYVEAQELDIKYVPGEIIVSTTEKLIDSSSTFTTSSVNDYTLINFQTEEIEFAEEILPENKDFQNTYLLKTNEDVLEKCKELEALPGIEYAEPNYIFETYGFTMPSEISLPTGTYANYQKWYFDLLKIPETWQDFETTGENTVIAVIDNGFDIDAYEFPQNLWTDSNGNHGWNAANDSADISPVFKSDGTTFDNTNHGTHVASIIGMPSNAFSAIGAAFSSEIMLLKVAEYVNDSTTPLMTDASIVKAINFAVNNGADIINMSIGLLGAESASLEAAINNAYNNGVALIAAAGNEGTSAEVAASIPAKYPNVIGVMASEKTNTSQLAYFSNYDPTGTYYDVAVPGWGIIGSKTQEKLLGASGTSQASPLVAACAALYLSHYPDATVEELYKAIRNSPTSQVKSNSSTVTDATYYFKFLNAYDLLLYGKTKPEIKFNLSTNVSHDPTSGYIYGLDEGYSDIGQYISVTEGTGTLIFMPNENGNGTGSIIEVYDPYGDLFKTFTIIIFGDTNGDSYADGQDAVIISWIISSPEIFSDPVRYAADVDFDNTVSDTDYSITANYAIDMDFISQIR